jgi:hypothetical protein
MKIQSLKIQSFRGFLNEITFGFHHNNVPCHTIILGDNGSGKSTICDAIEVTLQRKIGRNDSIRETAVHTLNTNENFSTEIVFSDKTVYKQKGYIVNGQTQLQSLNKAHEKFRLCPIILRRIDILNFWTTTRDTRLMIFSDFFHQRTTENAPHTSKNPEIETLNKKETDLRQIRSEKILELAIVLETEVQDIPTQRLDFESFCRQHVYLGKNNDERTRLKRKGLAVKVKNPKALPLITEILAIFEKTSQIKKEIKKIKSENNLNAPKLANKIRSTLELTLNTISEDVKKAFHKISKRTEFIENIIIQAASLTEMSFDVRIKISNGKTVDPKEILSEANLDLLGFLIYMRFISESIKAGQPPIFLLDDVLQSIDSTMRVDAFEWLISEHKDWQLIIATHEKLWADQITDIFRRNGAQSKTIHLKNWTIQNGPQTTEYISSPYQILRDALVNPGVVEVSSAAGLCLEVICHELSISLPISVTRKKNDKYTLGDLWPGILKILKKTSLEPLALKVDQGSLLRNLLGAHHNEYAQNISLEDVTTFGESVVSLTKSVWCETCGTYCTPVTHLNNTLYWQCKCTKLIIQRK